MKKSNLYNAVISMFICIAAVMQPLSGLAEDDNSNVFNLNLSRIISEQKSSSFNADTEISSGRYVLCRFNVTGIEPDDIYGASFDFDVSSEEECTFGLDKISDQWNGKSATKYSTTYGNEDWVKTTEAVGQAQSADGKISFDIKDSLKAELSSENYTSVNYAFYIKSENNVKVQPDSVKITISSKPNYEKFNEASESDIEELVLKYMSGEDIDSYKAVEDKSEIHNYMLSIKNYASMDDVYAALKEGLRIYKETHEYLYADGYTVEIPCYDYAYADINQKIAQSGYLYVGSYNNSGRAMMKFDLRDVDLKKAKSIKISYDTLNAFGNFYVYNPNADYTTNLLKMHSDWQSEGITYNDSFFENKEVVAQTSQHDKGTYATFTADVTEDVKTRGEDFISYYLMGLNTPYIVTKESRKVMLVEYPNDANGSYTATVENGETAVEVGREINLDFEKTLNEATVIKDNFTVTANGIEINDYTLVYDKNKVTFEFDGGMKYGTEYSIKTHSDVMYSGDELHYYFKPLTFKTDVEDFENDGLIVTDSVGAALTSLEGVNGNITAQTRLKNNKLDDVQNMIVSLVLIEETEYGEMMRGIKLEKVSLAKGQETSLVKTFELGGGKYRIEYNIWDSLLSMKTLYKSVMK